MGILQRMRVLVLGGYGNFGARICRALSAGAGFEILIAGRDAERASALAKALPNAEPLALDHHCADLRTRFERLAVDLVIHAAGPFQAQAYNVALAALQAGAHYVDLADGRRFVCDFAAAVHTTAVAARKLAVSGASTVPALSSAVVDHLCKAWQRIDSIEMCIAPAQSAPRGVATLEGVLSYCGADVAVWQNGAWLTTPGWCHPKRVTFHRLAPRLGAICDVPDLELFPQHYAVRRSVSLLAALEVAFAQRGLAFVGGLHRRGWLRRPERLAPALSRLGALLDPFGSKLGGMFVSVTGIDATGMSVMRSWHIAADDNHGPEIPSMPAVLLARRLRAGQASPPGAYPCVSLLSLEEFAPEFARWGMVTDIVDRASDSAKSI
jgi:NAD(P)-dependent dehydrogenase (short-subunit alcohol dehydrogenase family)